MRKTSKKMNLFIKTVIVYFIYLFIIPVSILLGQNDLKKIRINNDIELTKINDSFYVHTSWYKTETFGRVPSNGLLLVENGKALIIDTPMDDSLTSQLYDYLLDSMNVTVETFIAGHSHNDCMGGIDFLHTKNVNSIALDLTNEICKKQKLPLAKETFADSLLFEFYGEKVICKYLGPGHTIDNIVVYFPAHKILFGGCMIKSLNSIDMGYVKEADIKQWDQSVGKVKSTFTDVEFVIPGHGNIGDGKLLDHTIDLVKIQQKIAK